MTNKIVQVINQNRFVKSAINPKAIQKSTNIISTSNVIIRQRPKVIESLDISGMAIWDNSATTWDGSDNNDKWDSFSESTKGIIRVFNKFNTYYETFDYTQLQGSLNTCTWAHESATFTSGQILHINSAFKDSSNTQVVTSATLSATVSSGSFTFEMSANGGTNWESVSNNALHTFTNTGSDLQIRITENAASTGTITLIKCKYTI